jgi:hypothetical protein
MDRCDGACSSGRIPACRTPPPDGSKRPQAEADIDERLTASWRNCVNGAAIRVGKIMAVG